MTTTDINAKCPCGSEQTLKDCCQPYLSGKKKAPTAEALLRSRYTAFVVGNVDYILDTHHKRTSEDLKREDVEAWSKQSDWMGLEILQKEAGTEKDETGTIIFHARYKADGKVNDHYEKSLFEKDGGEWKFLDAQGLKAGPIVREGPKIGRNDPCACGSGKKFKKCCAA